SLASLGRLINNAKEFSHPGERPVVVGRVDERKQLLDTFSDTVELVVEHSVDVSTSAKRRDRLDTHEGLLLPEGIASSITVSCQPVDPLETIQILSQKVSSLEQELLSRTCD